MRFAPCESTPRRSASTRLSATIAARRAGVPSAAEHPLESGDAARARRRARSRRYGPSGATAPGRSCRRRARGRAAGSRCRARWRALSASSRCDEQLLGDLVRVGPRAVLVRVVGLERDVVAADAVEVVDADAVLEEAADDLPVVVLRRRIGDVGLAVAPPAVDLPHVVDAFEHVRDPADLGLRVQQLEAGVPHEHARVEEVDQRHRAVGEDAGGLHRVGRVGRRSRSSWCPSRCAWRRPCPSPSTRRRTGPNARSGCSAARATAAARRSTPHARRGPRCAAPRRPRARRPTAGSGRAG